MSEDCKCGACRKGRRRRYPGQSVQRIIQEIDDKLALKEEAKKTEPKPEGKPGD